MRTTMRNSPVTREAPPLHRLVIIPGANVSAVLTSVAQSCLTLCDPIDSPGKNTGVRVCMVNYLMATSPFQPNVLTTLQCSIANPPIRQAELCQIIYLSIFCCAMQMEPMPPAVEAQVLTSGLAERFLFWLFPDQLNVMELITYEFWSVGSRRPSSSCHILKKKERLFYVLLNCWKERVQFYWYLWSISSMPNPSPWHCAESIITQEEFN